MDPLYRRDEQVIAAGQKLRFFPQVAVGGHGPYLRDGSGRSLLDLSGSWGAASLGYSHPAVADAVAATLKDMPSASILSGTNEPALELAERLLAIVPGAGERKVWLGHSGSDANEAAVRMAEVATGRSSFIAFEGAYHGGTTGSMALSAHVAQEGQARHERLHLLPYPDVYREGPDAGDRVIAHLDALFDEGCDPDDVIALLLEPILSDGGMVVPPPGFVAALAKRCTRHGILLLCDEVKVGLGRTGQIHAFQAEGVTPELVTFGKGLGGGLPLSAAVGPARVFDARTAFAMQTTCGNPASASAGLAVLRTIESEGLVDNARQVGGLLADGLRRLQFEHPAIGDVRGRGLALGVELVSDRDSKTPASQMAAKVAYRAFELGAVVYCIGMESNVLELTPALTLTDEHVDEALTILDQAIRDVVAGRLSDEAVAPYTGW
jgi:4-aminobutyrate aminotransferase